MEGVQWTASWQLLRDVGVYYPSITAPGPLIEYCTVAGWRFVSFYSSTDLVAGPLKSRGLNIGLNIRGKPGLVQCVQHMLTKFRAAMLDTSGHWIYHPDYVEFIRAFLSEFLTYLPSFQYYLENFGLVLNLDLLDQSLVSRIGMALLSNVTQGLQGCGD